jgi:hypothetical protein
MHVITHYNPLCIVNCIRKFRKEAAKLGALESGAAL